MLGVEIALIQHIFSMNKKNPAACSGVFSFTGNLDCR